MERCLTTLILLTTRAPHSLAAQLMSGGYRVFEALAPSEVFHLTEQHDVDIILITPEYDHPALPEIQRHHTTMKLKADAKAADVIWEISNICPRPGYTRH